MADKSLILVSEVMASMGLAAHLESEITDAVTSAAIAAMYRLETEIDTCLRPHTVTELFNCSLEKFNGVMPNDMIHLRLSNFYLSASPVPTVEYSETRTGTYATVDADLYLLDYDRGVLLVDPQFEDQYIRVVYTCGFSDPDSVPEIIKQGLLSYIPAVFAVNQPSTEAGQTASDPFKKGDDFAQVILTRKKRQISICIRPMYVQEVAL